MNSVGAKPTPDLNAIGQAGSGRGTQSWAFLALLAALVLVPLITTEYVTQVVVLPVLVLGLAGLGLNILTGYAGQISLGSGGFMAVGAYAAYVLAIHGGITFFPLTLLLAGVIAGLVGWVFGLPSIRIKGFYVMVTSLAAQFFFEWLFLKFPWFYNYGDVPTISLPPMGLFGLDINGSYVIKYYFTLAFVVALTWMASNLIKSHVGRNWMAIRDMDTAAGVIGIDSKKYKALAFTISAFYLGIAGALWGFIFLGTTSVGSFQIDRSFQILFIIIIGGMSSIRGNYIGAAFIFLLPLVIDYFAKTFIGDTVSPGVLSNFQKFLFGALIIIFLIKEPDGIDKLLRQLMGRVRRWGRKRA
ncbi:amino acid/amide ABC transporter membrane protein 2 (HAAT family) [Rhodovulum imhoffii]|uniref:Amino acid/amide ABC transporter membrane protein 2 (HAAT family) n=1 Tax=Rhodovulum imhoffii TaxID=365340 RepID=A0A2T5BNP6_9RHOB|nr:branched-chain amino acid ABC transporter permease [Rhodovulum imhoffii]MBK5933610.1 branched-chain amino acid ABC transporter permease [Rhodovulum imhoffii]PTN00610.1 amino acid/amide ABC transporter membrane protein 2 (HAAT family) [Rhodovulum imhoffii]